MSSTLSDICLVVIPFAEYDRWSGRTPIRVTSKPKKKGEKDKIICPKQDEH